MTAMAINVLDIGFGGSSASWTPGKSGVVIADYNPGVFASLTFNGPNVSAIADQSGTGDANKNATQATGAQQPLYVAADANYNGLPTLSFPVASWSMTSGTWAAALVEPYTIFAVGHTTIGGGSRCHMSGNASNVIIYHAAAGEQVRLTEDGGATNLSSGVSDINTPSVVFAIANGASSQLGVNKRTANATGANGGPRTLTDVTLGNLGAGQSFALFGPLARVLVYQGALSPSNLASAMNGLGLLYGIPISA